MGHSKMFRQRTSATGVHFLGAGANHSHENFHAVLSAQNMDDIKKLTVSYFNCGNSSGCYNLSPFVDNITVSESNFNITETAFEDVTIYDVEYKYSGTPAINHLLTVFSDGRGEESIMCGVNKRIEDGGGCANCPENSISTLYDAECHCPHTCTGTADNCECETGGGGNDNESPAPSPAPSPADPVAKMFGYVIMGDNCQSKCVSWEGTLKESFLDNEVEEENSVDICNLLKKEGTLIRSQACVEGTKVYKYV